jgi:Ras-related protein Rab-7A
LERYVYGKWSGDFRTTIGADFLTKQVKVEEVDQPVTLQIVSTPYYCVLTLLVGHRYLREESFSYFAAGQERFVSMCIAFYRGADALVIVYDVNNPTTVQALGM